MIWHPIPQKYSTFSQIKLIQNLMSTLPYPLPIINYPQLNICQLSKNTQSAVFLYNRGSFHHSDDNLFINIILVFIDKHTHSPIEENNANTLYSILRLFICTQYKPGSTRSVDRGRGKGGKEDIQGRSK